MSAAQKQQLNALILDDRLKELNGEDSYMYRDRAYSILLDFVLGKCAEEMNSRLPNEYVCFWNKMHIQEDYAVSSVGIGIKENNWLRAAYRNVKMSVIEIDLWHGVVLSYAPQYREYAEKIKQDYDKTLKPALMSAGSRLCGCSPYESTQNSRHECPNKDLEMRLVEMQAKGSKRK